MSSLVDNNTFKDEIEDFLKIHDAILKKFINSKDTDIKSLAKTINKDKYESYLARQLTILISNYINNVIKELLKQHALSLHEGFSDFFDGVWSQHYRSANFKCEAIQGLLSTVNSDWGVKFKRRVREENRSALDTIVSNRNRAAHPTTQFSLTYVDAKKSYKKTVKVLTQVETIIKGS